MTNLSQKSEALRVVGHTPKGTGAVNPSEQLSQSTITQVSVPAEDRSWYFDLVGILGNQKGKWHA